MDVGKLSSSRRKRASVQLAHRLVVSCRGAVVIRFPAQRKCDARMHSARR
jgi:hypothetical protein